MPTGAQLQPNRTPYNGQETTGKDVLAMWHFDGNGKDTSGNGLDLGIRGKDTHFVESGKFSGALSIEERIQKGDTRQGIALPGKKSLNPTGAFTIEMWVAPSQQLNDKKNAFLIDNKGIHYRSDKKEHNRGYLLMLRKSGSSQFTLSAGLGFGEDSSFVYSEPFTFEADTWYHIAFTYDGKGLCTFYMDDVRIGQTLLEGRRGIMPSPKTLTIGDRVGSTGFRFLGKIDEVRILNKAEHFVSGRVLLSKGVLNRTVFYRREKATVEVEVTNDTLKVVDGITINTDTIDSISKPVPVPKLDVGERISIPLRLDTSLRPGKYTVEVALQGNGIDHNKLILPLVIMPRPLPHQMPITMWGKASGSKAYEDVVSMGYTDEHAYLTSLYPALSKVEDRIRPDAERVKRVRRLIDEIEESMVLGLGKTATFSARNKGANQYGRIRRDGKIPSQNKGDMNLNTARPEVQQLAYDIGASVADTYSNIPNWTGVLLGSEMRDHAYPSFTDFDMKAYRDFSGEDIPKEVEKARGVNYKLLQGFPTDRVVEDDHPILKYYKWYWKTGDGWNDFITRAHRGFKSGEGKDVLTWVGPATRVPSIWGSGGEADLLNQWTYTYPNPLVVDLAANELFAMADGRPGQKVMNMIQTIWYRSRTTATPKPGQEKEWEKISPEAKFISIAPDHLSEGTWLSLTYPVSAIANHGWGSVGKRLGFDHKNYTTTNEETHNRIINVNERIVKFLAPTLLQVTDRPSDVAFLQSFTSEMFANVGTYGWGRGWGADSYIIARYAGLQPKIIFEEHITRDGLDQYKVLFMTDCPVLPKNIVDVVEQFQRQGGIIVGDETLVPAIQPDIRLSKKSRIEPAEMKVWMQKQGAELKETLAPFYPFTIENNNPDIVTAIRQYGDSHYVFTINDNRTYGDYVGQYKRVMEKGLPAETQITLNTLPAGSVYDIMNHRQVPTTKIAGKVQFGAKLGAGEGNVFLVTPKPIGKLQVSAPASAKRGAEVPVKVLLPDSDDKTLKAVVPMNVVIRDSDGRVAERSGYYGAKDGQLNIDLDIAPNDAIGKWEVEVTEALTNQKEIVNFSVQ